MGYLGTKPANQVSTNTIGDSTITTAKLVDSVVTDAKIAAMAASKLTGQVPAANAPSGSVLQVVYGAVGSQTTTASSSPVDTGLTATITPKLSTSKIVAITTINGVFVNAVTGGFANFRLLRNAAVLNNFGYIVGYLDATAGGTSNRGSNVSFQYFDTPATTSATVYKVQFWCLNGATVDVQRDNQAVSSIILMEIAA